MQPIASAMDPRSMILLAGLMSLVMGLVLHCLRRGCPSDVYGLREWSLAPLASFASTVLFSLGDAVPVSLSIAPANVALFLSCVLAYAGSQRFLGYHYTVTPWLIATAALGLTMYWYTVVQPSYETRLAAFNGMVTLLFFVHLGLYLRAGLLTFGRQFMATVLLLQAAVAAMRLGTALAGGAGGSLMDISWLQTVYVSGYALTSLMLSVAGVVMVTERVRRKFEYLASRDTLTGVLNRRAWMEASQAERMRSLRHGEPMSILMVDVDHFKAVNDTYGHLAGDKVLRDLALRLRRPLRSSDRLGRYGGEEFTLLLPRTTTAEAATVAARLREALATPFAAGSTLAQLGITPRTASIGIAARRDADDTVDAMLARADAALYRAKQAGRDRAEPEA